jgi:hypothetical protein
MSLAHAAKITLIAAGIISVVGKIMWRAARSSNLSMPTVGMPVLEPS